MKDYEFVRFHSRLACADDPDLQRLYPGQRDRAAGERRDWLLVPAKDDKRWGKPLSSRFSYFFGIF